MLLHFLWQGCLPLLAAWGLLAWFRPARPETRYAVLLTALAAMFLCPAATWVWLAANAEPVAAAVALEEPVATADLFDQPIEASATSLFGSWLAPLHPWLAAAWLAGVALCGLRLAAAQWGLLRWRRASSLAPYEVRQLAARLARRLGYRGRIAVAVSHHAQQAMVMGLLKPLVLLPANWLAGLPAESLEAILAHELAHIRRRDLWVLALERTAETLFFFHPAVWWLTRRLRQEREECCDLLAVAVTGRPLIYVRTLEQAARARVRSNSPALAAALGGEPQMNLLSRVRNVLGLAPARPAGWWPLGLTALVLPAAVGALAWSLSGPATAADGEGARDGERQERREGDAPRREGERREGDAPREGVRREGDAPREGERREGDAPRREGDAPREGVRRDAEPNREGERREGEGERRIEIRVERREGEGREAVPADLMRIIAELRAEVAALREHVRRLEGVREGGREGVLDRIRERREGEAERREGDRPATGDRPREGDRPAVDRERGERDAPREGGDRPAVERPRGERDAPREGDRPQVEREGDRR